MYTKSKILSILLSGAIMLGIMTGCNDKPDNSVPAGRMAVQLTAGINPVSLLKVANDQWESADQIGLYMKKASTDLADSDVRNRLMTFSGQSLTSTPQLLYPLDGNVDFIAYYPYRLQLGANYTIPVDVTQQTATLPAEVLYSNNVKNQAPTENAVSLVFNYSLAKIEVTVVRDPANTSLVAGDFAALTMSIKGMFTKANLQLADGVFAGHSDKATITPRKKGAVDLTATFEALVLPANDPDITFEFHLSGETYSLKPGIAYQSANLYRITFELDVPSPLGVNMTGAEIISRNPNDHSFKVSPGTLSGDITISQNGDGLVATYTGTEPVAYQWYKDDQAIAGAILATFTPTKNGKYHVVVKLTGYTGKQSDPIVISSIEDDEPLTGNITISKSGNDLVAAYTGTEAVTYKWYRDNEEIAGETGATFTPTKNGTYKVTVEAIGFIPKTSNEIVISSFGPEIVEIISILNPIISNSRVSGTPIWKVFDDGPVSDVITSSRVYYRGDLAFLGEPFTETFKWYTANNAGGSNGQEVRIGGTSLATQGWNTNYLPGAPTNIHLPYPLYLTFDMGRKAVYTKMAFLSRTGSSAAPETFEYPIPVEFKVWGTNNPKTIEQVGDGSREANQKYWTNWSELGGEDTWKNDWTLIANCKYVFASDHAYKGTNRYVAGLQPILTGTEDGQRYIGKFLDYSLPGVNKSNGFFPTPNATGMNETGSHGMGYVFELADESSKQGYRYLRWEITKLNRDDENGYAVKSISLYCLKYWGFYTD